MRWGGYPASTGSAQKGPPRSLEQNRNGPQSNSIIGIGEMVSRLVPASTTVPVSETTTNATILRTMRSPPELRNETDKKRVAIVLADVGGVVAIPAARQRETVAATARYISRAWSFSTGNPLPTDR